MATVTWVATVGITWPDGRVEAGEVVPAEVVEGAPWLIEQGHVIPQERVDG